jgi:uroporphyrin-III C-methyltransferase
MIDFEHGTVWLVGAGPGDPDLLTRKAEGLLCAASVVFYDALVGPGVLELIPPQARRVYVGKRARRCSADQGTIDDLIVQAALAGERVVRLKGGDPAIFGRLDEELRACRSAGVPVRVCPGITAASAAAASLNMSLTLRGTARRLSFVTAHTNDDTPVDWRSLADPEATLAVYMGKAAAAQVAAGLIDAGLPPATPVALVENASLPTERHFLTRLDLLPLAARTAVGEGPTLLLIGQAARGASLPNTAPIFSSCDQRPR